MLKNPALNRDLAGAIVGTFQIEPGTRRTEHYECAAWFREHEFKPGLYEVRLAVRLLSEVVDMDPYTVEECARDCTLVVTAPTVIVDAYLGTLFGGVAVGKDQTGPREIGRESSHRLVLAHGWTLSQLEIEAAGVIGLTLFRP